MQVIDKYRILTGIGVIIGFTFLISIVLTARTRMIRNPQNSKAGVYNGMEQAGYNMLSGTPSDSIKGLNSGIIAKEKVALKDKAISVDF